MFTEIFEEAKDFFEDIFEHFFEHDDSKKKKGNDYISAHNMHITLLKESIVL